MKVLESNSKQNGKSSLKTNQNLESQQKTLGPVSDLEQYVSPEWWDKIFNANYLKTDADVVNDNAITSSETKLYVEILKLNSTQKILDVCCGQGRHVLELARLGFLNVEGFDRSHYLIQKARFQAKKENLNLRFKEGDARKISHPDCCFDVVTLLGNSFGYFETANDDLKVLREVFRILKPWGRILIDVSDGDFIRENYMPRSWEWIDKKHFVCRERTLSTDKQRLISREVITHVSKGVIADQFYAERLYSQGTLVDLLKEAGFSDINFHLNVKTDSARNQDLGMMQQRIILSASVKKNWGPEIVKKGQSLKNVAVIMGDHTKIDTVKPSSVFDDDDFYTIDQLKSALREMDGYNFSYFTNHTTLIQDLSKNQDKIDYVFNLCDEGFNNDARKELHVPSLLEMLNISYTGSGPQCLAYCYDKSLVRGVATEMGMPVPKAFFIKPEDNVFDLGFSFPVIVKPNFGDSSIGITQNSYAVNIEQLMAAIDAVRSKIGSDKPILVEEFLEGKDISVGIIGNPPDMYTMLPIIEEDYSLLPADLPKICGYEAKWLSDSPYWCIKSKPADLPDNTEKFIEESCLKLFERLECRDYCRFDLRLDRKGVPKLLEVNPNPGWCWDGHLAKMAKCRNMSYPDMIAAILKAAEQRLKIS